MALRQQHSVKGPKPLVRPRDLRELAPVELATVGSIAFVLADQRLHVFHFDKIPGMHGTRWEFANPRSLRPSTHGRA